jgi:hypothetical protein
MGDHARRTAGRVCPAGTRGCDADRIVGPPARLAGLTAWCVIGAYWVGTSRMVLVGGPVMFLAVKTTTSAAGLWVIVVVAVGCLALWLYMVEVFATRRGTRHDRIGTAAAPELESRQAESRHAEGATATASEVAVTRDDLPLVPRPRDSDRLPADGPGAGPPEGWTPPRQRQSPTDQPAPAEPRPGRWNGGPQEPG